MAAVVIRSAEPGDAEPIASAHAAAWRAAFTFLPPSFLEAMTAERVLPKWKHALADATAALFVAVGDGPVAGFLQVRADGRDGEVMALYVDPPAWRHGVGSALLAHGETWLAAEGAATAFLWTARDSAQAHGFYEHRGWVASGAEHTQLLGPAAVALHEVEYRKRLA